MRVECIFYTRNVVAYVRFQVQVDIFTDSHEVLTTMSRDKIKRTSLRNMQSPLQLEVSFFVLA